MVKINALPNRGLQDDLRSGLKSLRQQREATDSWRCSWYKDCNLNAHKMHFVVCVWRHDYVTHEKRQKCWSRRRWQPEEPLGDQWRNRTLRTHRFRLANTLQHHTHSWCDKRKGKMWEVTFSAHGDRVERLKSWTVNDGWHIERPKLVGVAIVDVKRYCRRQQQR